jgi:hypothetical protein
VAFNGTEIIGACILIVEQLGWSTQHDMAKEYLADESDKV